MKGDFPWSIAILSRSGQLGGMELRLLDEAAWLADAGYEPCVYFTTFEGVSAAIRRAERRGVRAGALRFPLFMEHWRGRRLGYLAAVIRARQLYPRLVADVVHVPFAWTDQGLTMLWLAGRLSRRVVISVHNVFPEADISAWHRKHLERAFARVVGAYGVSHAATAAFGRIFDDLLPPGLRSQTIPNFVDGDRFRPSSSRRARVREALGITEDAVVVASVGRVAEQKRPHMMLDMFVRVVRAVPDRRLHLVFVGGGELADGIAERARSAGLGQRVHVTGFVERPEDYLAAADVHVLASAREGFGIATVEAMAVGIPTLATDTPASREILAGRQGGLLIPLDDVDEASEMLQRIVSDDAERSWRGREARREVLEAYGRPVWEGRLATFYESVFRAALAGDAL